MTGDVDRLDHSTDLSGDALVAVVILQLGIPQLPSDSLILETALKHDSERHLEVTNILRGLNRTGVDDQVVIRCSALVHLSCEWAWRYRVSKKTSIITLRSGRRVRSVYRGSSSSRDLRRLIAVSQTSNPLALARAIVDLSPHTFGEFRHAANQIGICFPDPASLLCNHCVQKASVRALSNLSTGRPRLRELDRAGQAVKLAHQVVTGRIGSGRGTVSSAAAASGRPTGELHNLLLRIGSLYDLRLVTLASDDRLRRR